MKKIASVLLLAAVAPAAFAQTSAELSITGKLIPGACTISLGENLLDWGPVPVSDLVSAGDSATFTGNEKQVGLDIDCSAPRRVAIRVVDAKSGTSYLNAAYGFGLGLDSDGKKIGKFSLVSAKEPLVNGVVGYNGWVNSSGMTLNFQGAEKHFFPASVYSGTYLGFSETLHDISVSLPAIKTVSSMVKVAVTFNPDYMDGISDEVEMQGEVTFELMYL